MYKTTCKKTVVKYKKLFHKYIICTHVKDKIPKKEKRWRKFLQNYECSSR